MRLEKKDDTENKNRINITFDANLEENLIDEYFKLFLINDDIIKDLDIHPNFSYFTSSSSISPMKKYILFNVEITNPIDLRKELDVLTAKLSQQDFKIVIIPYTLNQEFNSTDYYEKLIDEFKYYKFFSSNIFIHKPFVVSKYQ